MANHKSAIKRHKQSQERRMRNRINKSKMNTVIRRVEEALVAGAEEAAQEALRIAIPVIQKTAGKGAIHKKKASRKISRLTGRVNRMMPIA